jgi:hypothetical protein
VQTKLKSTEARQKENLSFKISGFNFAISRIILIFAVGIESHYCEDFHIFDG